jgi:exodeoxyribonuclease VII large subunit
VTSSTGAAIHDILNVLKRRNPSIEVIIYPSLVQGATAAKSIAEQIYIANKRDEVDLLIVGRGGGSLEDLWAFNEEIVAYAISESKLPIVSAVGHEIDVTIADYVADMRAPTPSAAAELVSTDKSQLQIHIQQQQHRLSQVFQQHLKRIEYKLQLIESRLSNVHPTVQIRQANQHADNLTMRLSQAINTKLNDVKGRSSNLTLRLQHASPNNAIKEKKQQLQKVSDKLHSIQQRQLSDKRYQLQRIADILHSVSPLSTLSRGYSIAFKNDKVVRSVAQLEKGDVIETRISDGSVIAKVMEITQKNQ